jgi:hypothetical protein
MKWIITDDKIDAGRSVGRGNTTDNPASLPHAFRLLDDDGEVYYLGRSDDASSQAAFAPLDWAEGYSGCTTIEYRERNRWVVL